MAVVITKEKTLTHELGAGAPCLKCGDKCPGLDLHFWRKICRNCKCKQEDHDVLKSVSTRGIDNIGKLLMHDREANVQRTKDETTTAPPAPKVTPTPSVPKVVPDVKLPPAEIVEDTKPPCSPPPPTAPKPSKKVAQNEEPLPPPPDVEFPLPPAIDVIVAADEVDQLHVSDPPIPEVVGGEETAADVANGLQEAIEELTDVTSQMSQSAELKVENDAQQQSKESPYESSSDDEKEYEWKPEVDGNDQLMEQYMMALPKDKRPVVGSSGAKHRKKQLMRQLPPHDQEPDECHDLTDAEKAEMEVFVKQYRQKALGVAKLLASDTNKTCEGCEDAVKAGDVIVVAERAGVEQIWKPACFKCAECKELLVDLIYFYHDEKIFCGRHYCELLKPRCAACDELIFAQEYTQAEDCYWHLKHFCCWHCDQPLGGKNYVPHENQPVCIPCYEKSFAHSCSTCQEIIAPNTEWVTFEDHHWHAVDECFKCSQCGDSLVGKPCIPRQEWVFCSSKCKREKVPPGQ